MSSAIEIEHFSYTYSDGTTALSDISLTIPHGEKIALIGPNGAGKSTLLLAIGGFVKGSGKIIVDDIVLNGKNMKKIRARLGCCFENPDDQLFMPTLFDDIAFGPLNMGLDVEDVEKRVASALDTVGLAGAADKAPHHLSAGQKRAASIATVLSMKPEIITLDEPDGSLDPANRKKLTQLLTRLEQTLIIATCNMNFAAAVAKKVALFHEGRLIKTGDVKTIMSNSNLMNDYGLEVPTNL